MAHTVHLAYRLFTAIINFKLFESLNFRLEELLFLGKAEYIIVNKDKDRANYMRVMVRNVFKFLLFLSFKS